MVGFQVERNDHGVASDLLGDELTSLVTGEILERVGRGLLVLPEQDLRLACFDARLVTIEPFKNDQGSEGV